MELSQVVKHDNRLEATWTSICTFLRQYSSGVIHQHVPVFESLTRASLPFGGNMLAGAQAQSLKHLYLSQQEIREQVNRLTREITRLNTLVSPTQTVSRPTGSRPEATGSTPAVGIDRFRQENPNTPMA